MKQLTDEQLARQFHEIYERLAPSFGYETRQGTRQFDPESPNGKLMIAVCAEVLRLNGFDADGVHEAEKVCAEAYQVVGSLLSDLGKFETPEAEKILDNLSAGKLVHKDVLPWLSYELRVALDESPGDRIYKSADELFDSLGIDAKPRATGCPETMDDTGHFAEVDMPQFLRKQAS